MSITSMAPVSNLVSNIEPEIVGSATLSPQGSFEAGSYQTFVLEYTAGYHGIDDSGSLKIVFRFAGDQTRPQLDEPTRANYTTIKASNNAVLECRYDPKGNVRPWDRSLYIKVVHGFLEEGDKITITFGDTSGGSPGMRLQTFCEDTFEFRVLVDPIATYTYVPIVEQPHIAIIPGVPDKWRAITPTLCKPGQPFQLRIKGEDKWGNPSNQAHGTLQLQCDATVNNLPTIINMEKGAFSISADALSIDEPGTYRFNVLSGNGELLATSNPIRIDPEPLQGVGQYWGDLHGQSEETVGTNSARQYFEFARDKAFLDVTSHQGNDFQITKDFWSELNELTAEFNAPGRFITLPGYEWSGNTNLGGDRNVYYMDESHDIYRSSHALIAERDDMASDRSTAAELFKTLGTMKDDVVCFAHCGGRYADIKLAHDGQVERSVEIHSSWGTFEWILHDAFEMGYRVGIVSNSDGHKGRPGASYPGASLFGAVGGLTCLLMPDLTRQSVFDCLRKRHHFGTTGNRMYLSVVMETDSACTLYHDDPALGQADGSTVSSAIMGDIVHLPKGDAILKVDLAGSSPIVRIDLFNGLEHLETIRPYSKAELGKRIRVTWEGAEYRGRFRQVIWDGTATVEGNEIRSATPINFFNKDKTLIQTGPGTLTWQALTTGNLGGFHATLSELDTGNLLIKTPVCEIDVPISEIGYDDIAIDAGALGRRLSVVRLPDVNPHTDYTFERKLSFRPEGDNPIFVRVTDEDGHQAWSSPIYVYR
jgi:hypothetical protein